MAIKTNNFNEKSSPPSLIYFIMSIFLSNRKINEIMVL
ncbi:hypothetical protein LPE509_01273 [Legionella pneumophila subsp. pneumophila LPE509]|nr:hypothetical protein LPE509_01273 [Legionella pneumophila subsp. pneumophila LPE509]